MNNPGKPIEKVAIITKRQSPPAIELGEKLFSWLQSRGMNPLPDQNLAAALNQAPLSGGDFSREADLFITLGGDGTFLHTASLLGENPVPILGVNLGGLGFLTEAAPDDLFPLLEEIRSGKIQVEERIRLRAECRRGKESIFVGSALNDVFLGGVPPDRLIRFGIAVDREFLAGYRADGLIIATPTGSTAYNLSAGGPIVHPSHQALILTPVSPHTLTQRPLILPDSARVEITFPPPLYEMVLSLDGQTRWEIQPGDEIEVRKHHLPTLLVRPSGRSYFQILQAKLHWGYQ